MGLDVLFALGHLGHVRHFEAPLRELGRRGHRVRLLLGQVRAKDSDRSLRSLLADASSPEVGTLVTAGRSVAASLVGLTRGLRGVSAYLGPGHPTPSRARMWGARNVPYYL